MRARFRDASEEQSTQLFQRLLRANGAPISLDERGTDILALCAARVGFRDVVVFGLIGQDASEQDGESSSLERFRAHDLNGLLDNKTVRSSLRVELCIHMFDCRKNKKDRTEERNFRVTKVLPGQYALSRAVFFLHTRSTDGHAYHLLLTDLQKQQLDANKFPDLFSVADAELSRQHANAVAAGVASGAQSAVSLVQPSETNVPPVSASSAAAASASSTKLSVEKRKSSASTLTHDASFSKKSKKDHISESMAARIGRRLRANANKRKG
jgi:hypothetical protein